VNESLELPSFYLPDGCYEADVQASRPESPQLAWSRSSSSSTPPNESELWAGYRCPGPGSPTTLIFGHYPASMRMLRSGARIEKTTLAC